MTDAGRARYLFFLSFQVLSNLASILSLSVSLSHTPPCQFEIIWLPATQRHLYLILLLPNPAEDRF